MPTPLLHPLLAAETIQLQGACAHFLGIDDILYLPPRVRCTNAGGVAGAHQWGRALGATSPSGMGLPGRARLEPKHAEHKAMVEIHKLRRAGNPLHLIPTELNRSSHLTRSGTPWRLVY